MAALSILRLSHRSAVDRPVVAGKSILVGISPLPDLGAHAKGEGLLMAHWRYREDEASEYSRGSSRAPAGEPMVAGQAIQRGYDDRYYLARQSGFRGFVCEDVKPGQILEEVNPGTFRIYRPEEDEGLWRWYRRDFARRRNRRALISMLAVLVAAAAYFLVRW
jgi:hypothetical protein